jgi:ferritin-like metal-binding protein YciE
MTRSNCRRAYDVSADLTLVVAAQNMEHDEISGYGTHERVAGQVGRPTSLNS